MSLKEAMERQQAQETAFAKTQAYYGKMFEEVNWHGGAAEYENTLPVKLSQEYQPLIDEFMELCPPGAWRRLPAQADRENACCIWRDGRLEAGYQKQEHWIQVKLSDGSLHMLPYQNVIEPKVLGIREELVKRRLFRNAQTAEEERARQDGLAKILREAQEQLDRIRRVQYGAGESIRMSYVIPGSSYDRTFAVYLSREGTIYDTYTYKERHPHSSYDREYGVPYCQSQDKFERWLLDWLRIYQKET